MTSLLQGWTANGRVEAKNTMEQMRKNIRESLKAPIVWETAKAIVAGVGPRDEVNQAAAIRKWVAAKFRFVKDPIGVELLETPTYLLGKVKAQGYVQGDCDDAATISCALLMSIGIPCRLAAVAFGDKSAGYSHVFAVADPRDRFGNKSVVEFDVTRPAGLQRAAFSRHLTISV